MADFLFIGTHPDDLEIGAGGTIKKLVLAGHSVHLCVLTDDADPSLRDVRRQEAIAAASHLDVNGDQIFFLGLPDRELRGSGAAITALQSELRRRKFDPNVIVAHSNDVADSHSDHKEARKIAEGAFRGKVLLGFGVVNSLNDSEFNPRIFVDTTAQRQAKLKALQAHVSQDAAGRILYDKVRRQDKKWGAVLDTECGEAFDLVVQASGVEPNPNLRFAVQINDCPFHKFWTSLLANRGLYIIHEANIRRPMQRHYDSPSLNHAAGATLLKEEFQRRWFGPTQPTPLWCEDRESADTVINGSDVVLSGGPAANWVTHRYFNHYYPKKIRYILDYDLPDPDPRIVDRKRRRSIRPRYAVTRVSAQDYRHLENDKGLLTVMRNPQPRARANGCYIVGCMGIHSWGTMACHRVLTTNKHLQTVMRLMQFPVPENLLGYQLIVDIDPKTSEITLDRRSVHGIPM